MKLPRTTCLITALIALCSMLFMQLAVAAYACPMLTDGSGAEAARTQMRQAMPDCSGMDMEQPSLCAAYAHPGDQALDKPELPPVAPFIASALVQTLIPLVITIAPALRAPGDSLLARSTAPPLAI